MFLKNTLLVALVLLLAPFAVLGGQKTADYVTTEKLVYKADVKLAAFKAIQDYTAKDYAMVVRLESKTTGFFCSGTVISDDYVLTAAHCLMHQDFIVPMMTREDINVVSLPNGLGRTTTVIAKAAAVNTRAEYALVQGDFRKFTKGRINATTTMIATVKGPIITCGFPWGAKFTCYATNNHLEMYYERFAMKGLLYPGMSGGPVADSGTQTIIAVNTAVSDGIILVSPLIGLFETLGVRVIQ